ncbi:MAG: YceI family protein [Candidatus Kapabacteria bacterium]|nr:YceI family protein [Candidatus Kapabacteria bacterium]
MKMRAILYAAILIVVFSLNSYAEKYTSKSFSMVVSGTSTLHDWHSPASKSNATGDFIVAGSELQKINSMYVEVESKSIKSGKDGMDEKTWDCIKADEFPKVTFNLSSTKAITKAGAEFTIDAMGNLKLAGTSSPIDMQVKAKVLANGDVEISGVKKIKLSQFKLERPSAMLGTIKCGEEITLTFTVVLKKA